MNLDAMSLTPDQRQAISHVNGPLLLCAGAGSGKTFTLQQRIAYALSPESGPAVESVHQIMAITFTRKAAEEIKSRVRAVLRSEGMMDEALQVDSAWISTIHGMATRILQEFALEFNLDPDIQQLDETEMAALEDEALSKVLARAKRAEVNPYRSLLREFGTKDTSPSSVKELVNTLRSEADTLPARLEAVRLRSSLVAGPFKTVQALADAFEGAAVTELTAKQLEALEECLGQLRDLLAIPELDWATAAQVFASLALPRSSKGTKEIVDDLKEARGKALLEANLAIAFPYAETLLQLAQEVEDEYRRLKNEAGVLDMSDLLHLTYACLVARPDIAAELRGRFKLIMVDEFQDTNQLQINLIKLLCEDSLADLCTVGDAQQSIYRFQGADVNVYLGHKAEMQSPDVKALALTLGKNFRSHADILAFVRKVCGTPGYFPEPFLDLEAGRDEARVLASGKGYRGSTPRLRLALTSYGRASAKRPGGNASIQDAKALEAQAIASWFDELRQAGHSPSEMVILMGSTTHAPIYADALREHGFSCVMAGGSGFYDRPEVKLIVQLLQMLAEPSDTQALFAVLSSEMITLSADDLIVLSTLTDERFHTSEDNPRRCSLNRKLFPEMISEGSERLRHAGAILHRSWERVGKDKPSNIVYDLLIDTGYLARLEAEGPEGLAKAANLMKAIRLIQDREAAVDADMLAVAVGFAQAAAHEKEKLGSLMGDTAGSVRIMTAHSSKGLEFPFVAVVDCYGKSVRTGRLTTVASGDELFASLLPGASEVGKNDTKKPYLAQTAYCLDELMDVAFEKGRPFDGHEYLSEASSLADLHARMLALSEAEDLLERRRLFYVAATRASEGMLVAMTVPETDSGLGFSGVQADIADSLLDGIDFSAAPSQSVSIDYDGSQPLMFVYQDARALCAIQNAGDVEDAEAAEEVNSAEEPARTVAYPPLREEVAVRFCAGEKTSYRLVSYSSLAKRKEVAMAEENEAENREPTEAVSSDSPEEAGLQEAEWPFPETPSEAREVPPDKATEFGSAFHRLAQLAILQGAEKARAAIERQARYYGVHDTGRLSKAYERWVSSALFERVMAMPRRLAEYPFALEVGPVVLQGFIDLLCLEGHQALVVDYKTGGMPNETLEELHAKHHLQACSYAYALLKAGYQEVELVFVRVEQPDSADSSQPQEVTYRFALQDLPDLEAELLTY